MVRVMMLKRTFDERGKVKIGEPVTISYLCSEDMDEIEAADSFSAAIEKSKTLDAKYYMEIENSRKLSSPFSLFTDVDIQYFKN